MSLRASPSPSFDNMTDTPPSSSSASTSPQQLSFDIHPWLSSIESIADEYDLHHHESGASYSSYVSRGHSGSSRSGSSGLFGSQHREGSSSTAATSLSIGSVGSAASLLSGKQSERSGSNVAAGTSANQLQPPSRQATAQVSDPQPLSSTSGSGSGRHTGKSGLLDAPPAGAQLSSSPSRMLLRSPLSKAVDEDQDSDEGRDIRDSSQVQPSQQGSHKSGAPSTSSSGVMESPGLTGSFDAREDIWSGVARKLKPFGDSLRQDRLRSALGKSDVTRNCAELLKYSAQRNEDGPALHDAQIEMLRILANMCIDHEENRAICLGSGAPQAAVRTMQHVLDSQLHDFPLNLITLLRMAMGALNNMQLDHTPTREVLRQDDMCIETILRLATDGRIYKVGDWYRPHDPSVNTWEWRRKVSAGSYVTSTAWQLLQDICASEDAKSASPSTALARTQSLSDDEDSEKTFESILHIGATKAATYLVHSLEPFAAKAKNRLTAKGPWDADDVSDLVESDANAVQCASELIESCALDAKEFRIAALDRDVLENGPGSTHSVLEFLLRFLDLGDPPHAWLVDREDSDALPPKPSDVEGVKEALSTFARAKAAIARAIVLIVGEDDNMATLFEGKASADTDGKNESWFILTMKDWMQRDSTARDDLVSTAMLAIGNLARKDAHCISLVHDHALVPSLTSALQPDVDIKVAHAVVCLLKNLAIPPRNKAAIGQSNDLFVRLQPFIGQATDRVQPLQFAAVGLIKHLCSNCLSNALALTSRSQTFHELLELLKRTDDVPTKMEGTRALAATVKSLWSSPSPSDESSSTDNVSPFARGVIDVGIRSTARRRLVSEPVVKALADMVRGSTKYPVLVNEGILALTLLATSNDAGANGPRLVAQCLLEQPASRRRTKSQTGAAASKEAAQDLMEAGQGSSSLPLTPAEHREGETGDADMLQPRRQTTLDSLASNAAKGLPPIRTGADMVATVLARRDARMPPHFASNACALVQTLVQGHGSQPRGSAPDNSSKDNSGSAEDVRMDDMPAQEEANDATDEQQKTEEDSLDPIKTIVGQWLPSLQQLSAEGPQETVSTATQTLETAQALTAA